jgi:hypothetical protein
MNKRITAFAFVCMFVGAACVTEADGVLFLSVDTVVPDTTSLEQLVLAGQVVRTPARQGLITVVRVTGGAVTAVDTVTLHGLFSVNVPLLTNSNNQLSLTASDNTGAQTTGPWLRTVVQREAAPAASSSIQEQR